MEVPRNKLDHSNLYQVIMEYPNQLYLGQQFAENITLSLPVRPKHILVCGMGGSALPGDLLANYLYQTENFKIPIITVRGYSLPPFVTKHTLVLISSYSGNTEETLACFHESLKKKMPIIAFSKGGKVKEIAHKNNIPYVKYEIAFQNFQPRYALTYAFAAMQQVLTNLGLCDRIKKFPELSPHDFEAQGKQLAEKAVGKIPVIYASEKHKFLAKTWKIKLNENSHTPAFWNYFPELNHNEFQGFSIPRAQLIIYSLQDNADHPRNLRRMEISQHFYQKWGIVSEIIPLPTGKSFLEKVLKGLVLGDWFSYYLALAYQLDPTPSDIVETFKKQLG